MLGQMNTNVNDFNLGFCLSLPICLLCLSVSILVTVSNTPVQFCLFFASSTTPHAEPDIKPEIRLIFLLCHSARRMESLLAFFIQHPLTWWDWWTSSRMTSQFHLKLPFLFNFIYTMWLTMFPKSHHQCDFSFHQYPQFPTHTPSLSIINTK